MGYQYETVHHFVVYMNLSSIYHTYSSRSNLALPEYEWATYVQVAYIFFTRHFRSGVSGLHLFCTTCLSISSRKSNPPQNRQLDILISNSKQ